MITSLQQDKREPTFDTYGTEEDRQAEILRDVHLSILYFEIMF